MAVIYLVRHGQASFGSEDYDKLSELGKEQALVLGKAISGRLNAPEKVVVGGMFRHQQTHELVMSGWPSATAGRVNDSGWNEYDHQEILAVFDHRLRSAASTKAYLASLENPKKAFAKIFADATARWQSDAFKEEYSESWQSFKGRVLASLKSLAGGLEDNDTAMVFTSGGAISVVTQHLLGLDEEKLLNINWTLANCGITKLVKTNSSMFIATLNDHSHFEGANNKHLITYK